jgi:signal recognition particle subunit SRP54
MLEFENEFTLDDLREQLSQIGRLVRLQELMGYIPGMGALIKMIGDIDPVKDMKRQFGIIDAMTPEERRHPSSIIDQSRCHRVAAGAGVEPREVIDLMKHCKAMSKMRTSLAGGVHERWIRRNYPM